MKHGLFYTVFSWILDRFGYHLAKNPPRGSGRKCKGVPTGDLFVGGDRDPDPRRVDGKGIMYPVPGE